MTVDSNFGHHETMERILAKYQVPGNVNHIRHVTELALKIFDHLALIIHFPPEHRILLKYSALLHDIGHFINEEEHDRHTRYIIRNDAALNLLPDQFRNLLAYIAGGHRKEFQKRLLR
jgi:exopolyphosphatase/guanosine-5'-triphosphate,3'-diphosphate pyrophosphatase